MLILTSHRVFRTKCQQNVNILTHKLIKVLLGVVQKSIYTNEQKMMYDLLWGSNEASEPFPDCSPLKGLIILIFRQESPSLSYGIPPLIQYPQPPPPSQLMRISARSWKLFLRGAAVLAPLIFGIFLEGKGKKKIPFFLKERGMG